MSISGRTHVYSEADENVDREPNGRNVKKKKKKKKKKEEMEL
jgi:hypothetical protein